MIDASSFPSWFWSQVRDDGGNIRAYESDGISLIPIDVTYVNKNTRRGRLFVKHTITSASNTVLKIKVLDSLTTKLPVTDPNGRNAVWSDYEVVWQFPELDNRTGKAYIQTMNTVPHSLWQKVQFFSFFGNPHQGIAVDQSNNVITLDTNFLRKYSSTDLNTILASNANPTNDVRVATGGLTDHMTDGTIIAGELWSICNNFPALSPMQEHFAIFNLSDLSLNRTFDISGVAGEQSSSLCLNPVNGLIYTCNYETGSKIHIFNTSGVFQSSILLSTPIIKAQGIEYVDGKFYISQEATGNPIWEVETDGTVNGVIYNRPTVGINEGISYDGTSLWVLDGDGDLVRLQKFPEREDWTKLHFDVAFSTIDPLSTAFTMSASVYWTASLGDFQQGFLSYANGVDDFRRASLAYDEGPDLLSWWNSTDSWAAGITNPSLNEVFRISGSHNQTTARKLYVNGTLEITDSPISARPTSVGTSAQFILNGTETASEIGEGYYQNIWLRHEIMSDDWMAADALNMNDPSNFYTVT
jgi:outer membrane protein assembly factor BamB